MLTVFRIEFFYLFAFLGFFVYPSYAQDSQWEKMSGYQNPTGFPSSQNATGVAIGDFDGDHHADYFCIHKTGAQVAVRDSQSFHWTTIDMEQELGSYASETCAMDLDHDGADELIVFDNGETAWKLISTVPWKWEQNNKLLDGLYFPDRTKKAIFGDYNGDGLLEGVYWLNPPEPPPNRTERRNSNDEPGGVMYSCDTKGKWKEMPNHQNSIIGTDCMMETLTMTAIKISVFLM